MRLLFRSIPWFASAALDQCTAKDLSCNSVSGQISGSVSSALRGLPNPLDEPIRQTRIDRRLSTTVSSAAAAFRPMLPSIAALPAR
jgi:hypothetical protein